MHIGRTIRRQLRPERGDTCCIPDHGSRKVAALLFDKQYTPAGSHLAPDEVVFCDSEVQKKIEYVLTHGTQLLPSGHFPTNEEENRIAISLYYANAVQTAFSTIGIAALPVFSNSAELDKYCPSGPTAVYQAVIDNVPLIDDSHLSWDQVLEIRQDQEANQKLRDFRVWTRSLDDAITIEEAEDLIAQRLEDYELAIKKHGLETRLGAYKTVLDVREQLTVFAAGTAATLSGGAVWGILAAGAVIAAKR